MPWLFVTTVLLIIYLKLFLLLIPVSSGKCLKFQKHLEVWFLNKSVGGVGGVLTSLFLITGIKESYQYLSPNLHGRALCSPIS